MFAEKNERFRVEEKVFNPSFLYSSTWRGVNWMEIRLCVLRNWELSGWSPAEITLPREPLLNSPHLTKSLRVHGSVIVLPYCFPFQIVDPETKWLDTYFDCFFLNHALKSFFSYLSMILTEKTVQLTTPMQNTADQTNPFYKLQVVRLFQSPKCKYQEICI